MDGYFLFPLPNPTHLSKWIQCAPFWCLHWQQMGEKIGLLALLAYPSLQFECYTYSFPRLVVFCGTRRYLHQKCIYRDSWVLFPSWSFPLTSADETVPLPQCCLVKTTLQVPNEGGAYTSISHLMDVIQLCGDKVEIIEILPLHFLLCFCSRWMPCPLHVRESAEPAKRRIRWKQKMI